MSQTTVTANLDRWSCRWLTAVALIFFWLAPARALELVGGDINTTAPGTSFNGHTFALELPWNNVGLLNSSSMIYLGDIVGNGTYWVLTAYHVAESLPGAATFNGHTYATVAGSYVRLTNPDTSPIDLSMFRLDLGGNPAGLVTLNLRTSGLTSGPNDLLRDDLYYVGTGGAGIKRWGFNDYEGLVSLDDGFGVMPALVSDYDTGSANGNEAHVVGGDSGGAAFFYDTSLSDWQLAGVILAANATTNYSASISHYHSQIVAAAPEPSATLLCAAGLLACALRRKR